MTTKATPRYFTVGDLADRWHCSVYTIRRRLKEGELQGFHPGRTSRWLVAERAVTEYERAHSNTGRVRGKA